MEAILAWKWISRTGFGPKLLTFLPLFGGGQVYGFIAAVFVNNFQSLAADDDIFGSWFVCLLHDLSFLVGKAFLDVVEFAEALEHFLFVLIVIIDGRVLGYR